MSLTEPELRARMGEIHPLALQKSRATLDQHSRKFIAMSPFLVISTSSAEGRADVSPRGDPPGFVHVVDDHTILIPDRPGNNRVDTMANIAANPNVGCLFFIPGFDDTLRLNGKATLTTDANLLRHCQVEGKQPKIGMLIKIEEVFIHCAKALRRSKLWHDDYRQDRAQMPTIAAIILDQVNATPDAQTMKEIDEDVDLDYAKGLY